MGDVSLAFGIIFGRGELGGGELGKLPSVRAQVFFKPSSENYCLPSSSSSKPESIFRMRNVYNLLEHLKN